MTRQVTLESAIWHVEVAETHEPEIAAEFGCRRCKRFLKAKLAGDVGAGGCEYGHGADYRGIPAKFSETRLVEHIILDLLALEGEFRADQLENWGPAVVGAAVRSLVKAGELVPTGIRLPSQKSYAHRRKVWVYTTPEKMKGRMQDGASP